MTITTGGKHEITAKKSTCDKMKSTKIKLASHKMGIQKVAPALHHGRSSV